MTGAMRSLALCTHALRPRLHAAAAAAEAAAAEAQRKVVLGRKGIAQNRLSKKALRKEKSIVEPRAAEAARQCAEEESQYNALKLALKNIYA